MFTGDRSGDWVFRALHRFGFASSPDSTHREDGMVLTDAYITGALRCAPPQNKPTIEELSNCQTYLLQELQLLTNVQIIVAFGKIGFDTYLRSLSAMNVQLPSPKPSFGHNKAYAISSKKILLGSYHPSQQNTQTGRLTEAMFDDVFRTVKKHLE
jgi:uracil-DNA glycosylase family 4